MATSYSIKIDGTRRVVKSGLTSDLLIGGFELRVDGAGPKIRGVVTADALKKMVWIPKEPGSNIPGYWAEEGSVSASRSNAQVHSRDDMRDVMNRWNPNMIDPIDPGRPGNIGPVIAAPRPWFSGSVLADFFCLAKEKGAGYPLKS